MSTIRCNHPPIMRSGALLYGLMLFLLFCPLPSFAKVNLFYYGARVPLDSGFPLLTTPGGIARDSSGNLYIVDKANSQILKIQSNGSSSVLTITGGLSLSSPTGIAVGGSNTIYVADTGNNRIVILTPTDATTASASVLDTGALTPALKHPQAMAVDGTGKVYVADTGNNRVVRVDSGSATVLLSNSDGLLSPHALALDRQGNLYIANDNTRNSVLRWSQASGISPVSTPYNSVTGLAVDSTGKLYVAGTDSSNGIEYATSGVFVQPAEQTRYLKAATDFRPAGLSVDDFGNLYLTSTTDTNKVFKLMAPAADFGHVEQGANSPVSYELLFGIAPVMTLGNPTAYTEGLLNKDYTAGSSASCDLPMGDFQTCSISVNFLPLGPGLRRGALVVPANLHGTPVRPYSVPLTGIGDAPVVGFAAGNVSTVGTGDTPAMPLSMAFDAANNLFVSERIPGGSKIRRVSAAQDGSATDVNLGSLPNNSLGGVAFDALGGGLFFVSGDEVVWKNLADDNSSPTVISFDSNDPSLSESLSNPTGIAVDRTGNLYIADTGNQRILKATPGSPSQDPTSFTLSQLSTGNITLTPYMLAVDDNGTLYITDEGDNNRVVKVTPDGTATVISTGSYQLQQPLAVAVDGAGTLYISDLAQPNPVIVKVTATGDVSQVDTGTYSLKVPAGLAFDRNGALYVADVGEPGTAEGARILKIDFSSPRALTFADTNTGLPSNDSPQTVAVFNRGNQPLQFSADPALSNSADFQQGTTDSNACVSGKVLQPGESCGVSLTFRPQSGGSLSTTVTLKNNHLNQTDSTQTITATGTGIHMAEATIAGPANQPVQFPIGQQSAVDITVTGESGSPVPTGRLNVTLRSSGGAILKSGTADLTVGTAYSSVSLRLPTYLTPGNYTFTIVYLGDDNYSESVAPITVAVQLNRITPTINWAQPAAITYGTNLSAVLNAAATGAVLIPAVRPTAPGTLSARAAMDPGVAGSFTYTATPTGGAAVAVTGATVLDAGSYTLTASFTPSDTGTYTSATSSVDLTISKAAAQVSLTDSSASVQLNNAVTFTASVAGPATGTVSFYDGATLLGTSPLSQGTATYTTSSLSVGPHSITAAFSSGSNYSAATSSAVSLTINKAAAPVSLTASSASVQLYSAVTFTASVAGSATGTVSFYDGATLLSASTLSHGAATYTTSSLAVGTHSITATSSGDGNYSAATSSAVSLVVDKAAAQVSLASPTVSRTSVPLNTPVGFLVLVSIPATDVSVPPTGTVSLYDGSTLLGTSPLTPRSAPSQSLATFSTSSLALGPHSITAAFSGDGNYSAATSSALSLTVNKRAAPVSLSVSPSASVLLNSAVTFTASVAEPATGTVSFYDGPTLLGTSPLSQGKATFSTSSLAVGTHSITATSSGDGTYSAATSSVVSLVVDAAAAQVSLTVSSTQVQLNNPIKFLALISGPATGTVSFYDGSILLGTSPLTPTLPPGQSLATFSTSSLAVGTHSITAAFSGDGNYAAATSSAVSLTVSKATPTITLASSANAVLVTNAVTFTATVASTVSGATGPVDFYDGTTLLGTVALSNGTAAYTTSSLAAATHIITATYVGNVNFNTVTSAPVAELVQDFSLSPGSGTGGNGSTAGSPGSVPTQTISAGGTAAYTVIVGPTAGTTLSEPVTLTVTHNLPPGSTAFLGLVGTSTTGTTLVIPGGQPMPGLQLLVHVPSAGASTVTHNRLNPLKTMPFAVGFLLLPFGGRLRQAAAGKRARRTGLLLVLGLLSLAALIGLSGCGAVNSGYLTEQNYTINVTATSGSLSRTTTFNLVVR